MKKYLILIALLVLPTQFIFAEVDHLKIDGGKTLYKGGEYTLTWKGEPEDGADTFSVWLVGGTLGKTGSKMLGEVDADAGEFDFVVPEDIRAGKRFIIQLSGYGASGDDLTGITIKNAKKDSLGSSRVILEKPVGSVVYEGFPNVISWKGGKGVVKVGIESTNGTILGWIKVDGKKNGKITWDTKNVCDLAMSTCWNTQTLLSQYSQSGKFKIVIASEDKIGNIGVGGEANYDKSDDYFAISSMANTPGVTTANLSNKEKLQLIEDLFGKDSAIYARAKELFQ